MTDNPLRALEAKLGEPDPAFDAWRNSVPDKHWAKRDLSALRLGYELGKTLAAPAQDAVAWRFWIDDPTSCLVPHWTGWSTDVTFRDSCAAIGYKAELAYPPPTPSGNAALVAQIIALIQEMRAVNAPPTDEWGRGFVAALGGCIAHLEDMEHALTQGATNDNG